MIISVNYKGAQLELEGDLTQSYTGGFSERSQAEYFETTYVFAGEEDITNFITEADFINLDELAIETLN
tara:strand:+ start:393 stop:599 length:207 start_codon:yes stop_codon:yes gene_type:complete